MFERPRAAPGPPSFIKEKSQYFGIVNGDQAPSPQQRRQNRRSTHTSESLNHNLEQEVQATDALEHVPSPRERRQKRRATHLGSFCMQEEEHADLSFEAGARSVRARDSQSLSSLCSSDTKIGADQGLPTAARMGPSGRHPQGPGCPIERKTTGGPGAAQFQMQLTLLIPDQDHFSHSPKYMP